MKNEMLALILAGGQGTRLGKLTQSIAKPAVQFGGRYRIIDFALSNCANSWSIFLQKMPWIVVTVNGRFTQET